jgi:glutamate-1-semialdehyde 2,1-aminomutase
MKKSFISSTCWTERVGPVAALKALQVMKREKSWEQITQAGMSTRKGWQSLADSYGLKIEGGGLPALASFNFKSPHAPAYKRLITQEMLKKGYLAGNCVYSCIDHKSALLEKFFDELGSVFSLVKQCEEGCDIKTLLDGPICHSAFRRLN